MGIVELKNDKIAIKVNTHGAELVSLKSIETDREYMWCGDAEYWGRVSPVLFPFVGKLEGQRYRQDRKSTRLNSSHPLSSRMPSSA